MPLLIRAAFSLYAYALPHTLPLLPRHAAAMLIFFSRCRYAIADMPLRHYAAITCRAYAMRADFAYAYCHARCYAAAICDYTERQRARSARARYGALMAIRVSLADDVCLRLCERLYYIYAPCLFLMIR